MKEEEDIPVSFAVTPPTAELVAWAWLSAELGWRGTESASVQTGRIMAGIPVGVIRGLRSTGGREDEERLLYVCVI